MTVSQDYHATLRSYFEEEIEGEAYFEALIPFFDEPGAAGKLALLARIERCAAEVTRPLLARHGLEPRPDEELRAMGVRWVAEREDRHTSWQDFVGRMARDYPRFIPMFEDLEAMAPEADRPRLAVLTEHEHVAIRFAERELAGDPDAADVLRRYIADCDIRGWMASDRSDRAAF
jgi:dimethylamine/trimethylamine dehydrogenase